MVYDGARASCSDPNSCSIGIAFQQAVQDHHTSGGGGDSCSSVVGLAFAMMQSSRIRSLQAATTRPGRRSVELASPHRSSIPRHSVEPGDMIKSILDIDTAETAGCAASWPWARERRYRGLGASQNHAGLRPSTRLVQDDVVRPDACHAFRTGAMRMFGRLAETQRKETSAAVLLPDHLAVTGFLGGATADLLAAFIETAREHVQAAFSGEVPASTTGAIRGTERPPLILRPAGMLLTWLRYDGSDSPPDGATSSTSGSGGTTTARMNRIHPGYDLHVDKANHPRYDVSSLIYLSDGNRSPATATATAASGLVEAGGMGFTGGRFVFVDDDADRTVTPMAGRLLAFDSGYENAHRVAPLLR